MKLIKRYVEKLPSRSPTEGTDRCISSGMCWIDEEIIGKVLTDIKMLDFDNLYSKISVGLFNEGLVPQSELKNIEKIQTYLETKDQNLRTFCNSYFLYLHKIDINIPSNIVDYVKFMMEEIKENNDVIYVDTDRIFYRGDIDLLDIKLTHSNELTFDYLIMSAKKRYIYYNESNGGFFVRGYAHSNFWKKKSIEGIDKIKQRRREDRLDEILF